MNSTAIDRTMAEAPGCYLTTASGTSLRVRPATPSDGPLVQGLFARVSGDDMRFRFLASRAELSEDDLSFLLNPDRRRAEHLLAFDTATGELVASLLLVADEDIESAEVAIATAQGWKAHGIGHALLKHAIELGSERGVKQLRSLEDRANCAALEVERTLGFQMHEVPGEPTLLMMETDLA